MPQRSLQHISREVVKGTAKINANHYRTIAAAANFSRSTRMHAKGARLKASSRLAAMPNDPHDGTINRFPFNIRKLRCRMQQSSDLRRQPISQHSCYQFGRRVLDAYGSKVFRQPGGLVWLG